MAIKAYGIHVAEDGKRVARTIERSGAHITVDDAPDDPPFPSLDFGCPTCRGSGLGEEVSGGHRLDCPACDGLPVNRGSAPSFMAIDVPWSYHHSAKAPRLFDDVAYTQELLGYAVGLNPPAGNEWLASLLSKRDPGSQARPAARQLAMRWSRSTFVMEARPWASLMFAGCPVPALLQVVPHEDLVYVEDEAVGNAAKEIAHWLDNRLGLDIMQRRLWGPASLAAIACALTAACVFEPVPLLQGEQAGWRLVARDISYVSAPSSGPAYIFIPLSPDGLPAQLALPAQPAGG